MAPRAYSADERGGEGERGFGLFRGPEPLRLIDKRAAVPESMQPLQHQMVAGDDNGVVSARLQHLDDFEVVVGHEMGNAGHVLRPGAVPQIEGMGLDADGTQRMVAQPVERLDSAARDKVRKQ